EEGKEQEKKPEDPKKKEEQEKKPEDPKKKEEGKGQEKKPEIDGKNKPGDDNKKDDQNKENGSDEKDDITPKISPEAQKIQNEIKVKEDEIDKKIVELKAISKSELNDLEATIEDAEEQIKYLNEEKTSDMSNVETYDKLIKDFMDIKSEAKKRQEEVKKLLVYNSNDQEFSNLIKDLEQEKVDADLEINDLKELLKDDSVDKKSVNDLVKIFEDNKKEIDKKIDLYKNLSIANSFIVDIDNQIEQLMKKMDDMPDKEELKNELTKKKNLLFELRKEIKELIDKISQEQLQLEKYL
ncbi:coiled-coil domain-containing protein, partial [Mycoplasma sp. 2261]